MRDDRERIQDILDAISHIEKYAIKGRKTFDRDEVWATIEKDIPVLKQQLLEILENKR